MTAYIYCITYPAYYRYDWRFTGGSADHPLKRTPHRPS